jgi:uncharacterized protein (UPF0335 family)
MKNGKKNTSGNPGKYGERLVRLETKVENIEGDIKDINNKLGKLSEGGK